jgi:hypothetical protein
MSMHKTNEATATQPDELAHEDLDQVTGGAGETGIVVAGSASSSASGMGAGKVAMQDFHFVSK